jgi:hypothetical protein
MSEFEITTCGFVFQPAMTGTYVVNLKKTYSQSTMLGVATREQTVSSEPEFRCGDRSVKSLCGYVCVCVFVCVCVSVCVCV